MLRGWFHAIWAPVTLIAGLWLTVTAPDLTGRIGAAVWLLGSVMLFGTSAVYHRGNWSPRATALLRRWDHSNIFVFIAATYTPLALQLTTGNSRVLLLTVIWVTALLGLAFRILWLGAPRWLYTILYLAMGWTALGWLGEFWHNGGPVVVGLVLAGGVIYSAGAIAYALKKPNPIPSVFGFHEVFHACTVLASACHFAAITIATFA
nr:hemolysin III family protein [Granulicoccus phenolivorans]